MTDREHRLRERIDTLSDRVDTLSDRVVDLRVERRALLATTLEPRRLRHCVYCGHPRVKGLACAKHRDLLALDPKFNDSTTEPGSSTLDGTQAAGLRRDGV